MQNELINKFMMRMSGKIPNDELKNVITELQMLMNNYDVSKKTTDLVVYHDLYEELRVYMVTKKIEGRSEGTLSLYKLCLADMLTKIGKPVKEITSNDLRAYLYNLQNERKISDRTLDDRRVICHTFFCWCVAEKYIDHNPCDVLSPIKYEIKERKPFSDVEMELLRDACKTEKERAIIEVLYSTGCRVSELTGLKKSDINFVSREVHLFGKGKKHRISYINARAEIHLKKYFELREDDNEHVFVSDRQPHHELHKEGIEKIVRIIGQRADLKDVYPHRFRHTMATDALDHGMPVTDLQNLLGHSRLETSMIYAKVSQTNVLHNHKKCII